MGRRKMKSFKSPSPTSSSDAAKQSSENIMHVDGEADNESMAVEGLVVAEGSLTVPAAHVVEPTSSDYYFDSYAHFGLSCIEMLVVKKGMQTAFDPIRASKSLNE
ncbi:unnamed protein product [Calypogeia fissa]